MEAEERPAKLRKLTHASTPISDDGAQQPPSIGTETCKNVLLTANVADEASENNQSDTEEPEEDAGQAPNESEASEGDIQPAEPMSKNQLKKQRRREEWEAGREYRKAKRKQKIVEKRARKREARVEQAANAQLCEGNEKRPRPRRLVKLPITILIDCGFDDLMAEKEMISLASQLTRSYSDNSRAPFQAHLVVSSWGGLLKQRFDTVLNKHYLNWKGVNFVEDDFVKASDMARGWMRSTGGGTLAGTFEKYAQIQVLPDLAKAIPPEGPTADTTESGIKSTELSVPEVSFALNKRDVLPQHPNDNTDVQKPFTKESYPDGEIIYLTSDSPNVLTELKPYSTYIVGGLVDKNRHKGICYKIATAKGFKTAKLPIGEYMEMQSRFVLATNHVVEIMLRWLECGDWGEAFMQVIPKRKGGKLKEEDE